MADNNFMDNVTSTEWQFKVELCYHIGHARFKRQRRLPDLHWPYLVVAWDEYDWCGVMCKVVLN